MQPVTNSTQTQTNNHACMVTNASIKAYVHTITQSYKHTNTQSDTHTDSTGTDSGGTQTEEEKLEPTNERVQPSEQGEGDWLAG